MEARQARRRGRLDRIAAEVEIGDTATRQLARCDPQLLGRGSSDEVPAVEDPVDRQVRKQGEGERDGQRAVNLVGGLADAELVGEPQLLVAQEAVACSQTGLEGGLDRRRVDRDDRDPTVGDFSGLMELDQLPQLDLSLGSPGPAIEGENERAAVGHLFDIRQPQMNCFNVANLHGICLTRTSRNQRGSTRVEGMEMK